VPTPWASWVVAARAAADPSAVSGFLERLNPYVRKFDSAESRAGPNVEFIKAKFGYEHEDVVNWLKTVGYPKDVRVVPDSLVLETLT
jgi:hypothetical protein